jgi:hypothetical protein
VDLGLCMVLSSSINTIIRSLLRVREKKYFYGWFVTLSRSLEMYFFEAIKNLGRFCLFVEATINIIGSEK